MYTMTVDDRSSVVNMLIRILKRIEPESEHIGFTDPKESLQYAGTHTIDVAFLDVEMPDISGIELAKKLQKIYPLINIVFITGYEEYMPKAFQLSASDYLMKPVTEKAVVKALSHLRYRTPEHLKKPVRVQCFGNFEVFVNDIPVKFTRAKCKELFAYLIDRNGAVCTKDMIVGNLWAESPADDAHKSMARTVFSELSKTFHLLGIDELFLSYKNGISVNVSKVDCDYYRYLAGDPYAIHKFIGEYMTQYEFAAETRAYLQGK